MRHAKTAFTLVEMLVVIVIIAVLIAILLPVLAKAREKARQSTCISNQRQLTQAIIMALQDLKDSYPGIAGQADATAWRREVGPYIKSEHVYRCPTSTHDGSVGDPAYGMNYYLYGIAAGSITVPENTILLADANSGLLSGKTDVDMRHNHDFIASFVDGHQLLMHDNSPVIWSDGDEGTLFNFAPSYTVVSYSDANTARTVKGSLPEGETVLLDNTGSTPISAVVSVTGGQNPPAHGLIPGVSNTDIAPGSSRAFTLNCRLSPAGGHVDTVYTFGQAPSLANISVYQPPPEDTAF